MDTNVGVRDGEYSPTCGGVVNTTKPASAGFVFDGSACFPVLRARRSIRAVAQTAAEGPRILNRCWPLLPAYWSACWPRSVEGLAVLETGVAHESANREVVVVAVKPSSQ